MTKKIAMTAALLAAALTAPAHAAGWTFLPVAQPGFKLDPVVALTVNSNKPDQEGSDRATGYGLDFNFNCGLIQDPDQRMRTHLNVSHTSKDGVNVNAVELSPRYTIPLGNGVSVGVGPSLGSFHVSGAGVSKTLYGAGFATGLNYRAGQFYTGFDLRYHATGEKDGVDYDPASVGVKVGVSF